MDPEAKDTSKDATEIVLNDEKQAAIAAKINSAAEFETKIGDHGGDISNLINTLTNILDDIIKDPNDVVLAGFSEACISVLLKHLDTSGKVLSFRSIRWG